MIISVNTFDKKQVCVLEIKSKSKILTFRNAFLSL